MRKPFQVIIFPLSLSLLFGITAAGKEDQKVVEITGFKSQLNQLMFDGFPSNEVAAEIKADEIKKEQKRKESRYIKNIPLSKSLQEFILTLATDQGLDPYLILAIIEVESRYKENAVSADGMDYGLMQIRQINHSRLSNKAGYQLNYMDGKDNITAGIMLLKELYEKHYTSSGLHCVLMAYNQGETSAQLSWDKGRFSTSYSWKVINAYDRIKCNGSNYKF